MDHAIDPSVSTSFADLDLTPELLKALQRVGYQEPTPIQTRSIPLLLQGRDLLGCAQTGTGKTAAFSLPMLQLLMRSGAAQGKPIIRALVLSPTRELAAQIEESFREYGRYLPFKTLVVFGGVKQNAQVQALKRGVHILVATPGRLLDLVGQGFIHLDQVQFFVLDEADRMLDMGFIHDIKKVLALLPGKRQNLLFSATLPPDITRLAGAFLDNPVRVDVSPPASTVEQIAQRVMFVTTKNKPRLLIEQLSKPAMTRVLIFTRTKHGANRLVKHLDKEGIPAAAIHGNKSQSARIKALAGFHAGEVRILVATDLASRGLDVDQISHVINFDIPHEPEVYVHRIGRTGRAGLTGEAISFCDASETTDLRSIERLIGKKIPVDQEHAFHNPEAMTSTAPSMDDKSRHRQQTQTGRRRDPGQQRPRPQTGHRPARSSQKPASRSTPSRPARQTADPTRKPAGRPPRRRQRASNSPGGGRSSGAKRNP